MLSPNASNRVTEAFGGSVTVTVNVHASVRCLASEIVQLTAVAASG